MKTLYDLLGIRPDADPETIKRAFRIAVKAHHPDLRGGDAAGSQRLRIIIAANEVLRDPERRAAYDRHLAIKRQRLWSERRRTIIRFALEVVVLSFFLIGAVELWRASITMPKGKVVPTTQQMADVAAPAQPEQDPPTARSAGMDTQPAAETSSGNAGPPSPSSTPESGGGIAEPEAVVDASIDASPVAVPLLTTASSYRERATDWSRRGDLERAIADLDRAIELAPDDAQAYRQRGNVWARKGDTDRALADYEQALRIDPRYPAIFHDRGLIWRQKGEFDKALADFDRAVRMSFTDPEVYSDRGAVWFEKGWYDRALADLNHAIKINPGLAIAYVRRAAVFERKGDQERAHADREQASHLDHGAVGNIESGVGSDVSRDR